MKARILGVLATGLLAGPMSAQSSTLTPIGNITVDSTIYSVSLLSDMSSDLQTFNLLNPSITFNTAAAAQAARDALVATFGLGFDWNPTCTVCFDGVRVVYGFDALDYFYFTANVLGSFGPVSSGRDVVNGFSFAQFTPVAVPEPGTLALLGLGLAGLVLARRRNAHSEVSERTRSRIFKEVPGTAPTGSSR